ncbi:MAG TPA: FdrA family protein [Nocardioidaceae bacterium]|nr:FdrA family protein [Nocardioidaceae bacterium]
MNHVEVRTGAYADSVTLLQVSRSVGAEPGVDAAMVAMATPLNLDLLADMGFATPDAGPNDMVVAIRLVADGDLDTALAAVDRALSDARRTPAAGSVDVAPPRTTASALRDSDATMALISVPGPHAFVEAMDAIAAGRDVMVFSDNVPLDQEVRLKTAAAEHGQLVMGPDCGTAVVDGLGLGFANAVRPGPVGVVSASGTGCQQVLGLLDAAGVGVTAALGVGGRDLSEPVGGLSTRQALRRLDADPATALIAMVSKPPAAAVAAELAGFASELSTPVEFLLLGRGEPDLTAGTERVLAALDRSAPTWPTWGERAASPRKGYLRGLFGGGTLCDEAMVIATGALGPVRSNIPLDPGLGLDASLSARAHLMIDFGDDALTTGRAHPMIDSTLRLEHLARFAADPDTAVLLLDVVLGHGAHPDPGADLGPAIRSAVEDDVPVVVALVGTAADPQGVEAQGTALAAAGAEVFASNAEATRRAVALVAEGGAS